MFKKIYISLFVLFFVSMNIGVSYSAFVGGGFSDKEYSRSNNFSAASLNLNLTDTMNNQIFTPLFYMSDLIPDVTRKNSFNINKEGTESFKYNIYFVRTGSEAKLCEGLLAEAKMNGITYFNGNLTDLSIFPRPEITDASHEWQISITLPLTTWDLRHKNCSFDIIVKGWQMDSDGSWGFSDIDKLDNSISTSTWELPEPVLESLDSTQTIELETDENNSSEDSSQGISDEPSVTPTPVPTPIPTPTPTPEEESIVDVEETLSEPTDDQDIIPQESETGSAEEDVVQ